MAKTYKGITIEIDGKTTGLQKALKEPQQQAKDLQYQLRQVESALKMEPGNTDLIKQKHRLLGEQVKSTEEQLKMLKKAQTDFNASGGDINSKGYVELQSEIVKTEDKLKSLQKAHGGLSESLTVVSGKLNATGDSLIDVGKSTAKYSVAATGALTGMTVAAVSFDEAWTGVKKVYQGSDDDLDAIRKSILELSSATGTSAKEIAAVTEAGATLGITGNNLIKFTEVMVMLGDTTAVSSEVAADSLGKLMNITKTSAENYDNLGSSIVALGNQTAASEDTIIQIAQRFASAGTQAGMTEAQILGLAASMNAVGVEGEAAGSSLSRTTNKINSAVASSSKELDVFAKTAGMSASEFKTAWEEDAGNAFETVIIGLNQAASEGADLTSILADMGINSTNDVNAMLSLATSSDVLTDALRISNEGWAENTALTDEASTYYDSSASKMKQLKETMVNLGAELGSTLLPILSKLADWLKEIANWFSNLNPFMQQTIVVVLAIVAAVSPLLMILGSTAKGLSNIINILPVLSGGLSKLFGLIMANPIIAAIGAVIAALVLLYNNCEWFRDGVNAIVQGVIGFFSNFKENVINIFSSVIDFFKNNWQGILLFIVNPIAGAFKLIYDNCEGFRKFIDDIASKVAKIFSDMKDAVVQKFKDIGTGISQMKDAIFQKVSEIIEFFKTLPYRLGYFIGSIVKYFIELPGRIKQNLDILVQKIIEFTVTSKDKFVEWCSSVITSITNFFIELPTKFKSWLDSTVSKIVEFTTTTFDNFKKWASDTIITVVQFFSELPSKIWNGISRSISDIGTWGSQMVSKGKESALNLVSTIVDTVASIPGKMLNIGYNIVSGIWEGIMSAKDWLFGKISGFADGIVNGFKDALGIHSPSERTEKEVGVYTAQGVGVGFLKGMKNVNKDIESSLNETMGIANGVMASMSGEAMTKQLAFETMSSSSHQFTGIMEQFKTSVLDSVEQMLSSINLQNVVKIGDKTVADELTPLMDKKLQLLKERGGRQ